MKRFAIVLLIAGLCFSSCEKDAVENPAWLTELIEKIENDGTYYGSTIYRHEWKSEYYYELFQPISSCMFCRVYNKDGALVNWSEESMENYSNERKNETVIWKWGEK